MAHHIRVRHKGKAFIIDEITTDQLKLANSNDDSMVVLENGESDQNELQRGTVYDNSLEGMPANCHYHPCIGMRELVYIGH